MPNNFWLVPDMVASLILFCLTTCPGLFDHYKIPRDITKNELSDLISCKVEDDTPASQTVINIAREYGIETTSYVGEASLYSRIFSMLSQPGREHDLVAWFAFNVFNDRAAARRLKPVSSPADSQFISLAEDLASDTKVVQSIRRYSGESLRWFGERTFRDGFSRSGGSNRTAAYKAVVTGIDNSFKSKSVASTSIPKTSRRPRSGSKKTVKRSDQGSAIGLVAIILVFVIVIWALN